MNWIPKWKAFDPMLMGLSLLATLLGIFIIYDAGFARNIVSGQGPIPREFISQCIGAVVALIVGAYLTRIPVRWWREKSRVLMGIATVAVFAVAVPGLGYVQSGAKRWLNVPIFHPQPSEFAKVAVVLFLAGWFAARRIRKAPRKNENWAAKLDSIIARGWPMLLVLAVALKIEREPDLGTASVVLMIMFGMFILGGVSKKSLAMIAAAGVAGLAMLAVMQPYRLERITNHPHRWEKGNVDDIGYQTTYSESAMAAGFVVGVGPGAGAAKHVLPARMTDFIMATIGEEFGVIGSLCVIALMGAITWRLFTLGQEQLARSHTEEDCQKKADHRFAYLVLSGLAVWIGVQSAVNVVMANGTAPPIGIPLPFFSAGGSSLIALWIAVALANRCAFTGQVVEEVGSEGRRLGWRNRRARLPRA